MMQALCPPPTMNRSHDLPHTGRVPALDGLRGIAVLLVLMNNLYPGYPDRFADRICYIVSNTGWMGVDLFFVLSGFLITGILLDSKGDEHYFRNFYARRLLRIFPLYYGFLLAWIVFVSVIPWFRPDAVQGFMENQGWYWTYLANVKIARHGWGQGLEPGLFWSLAVEEQFYLLWPLVVLWADRRRLAAICIGMFVCALFLRLGWRLADPSAGTHLALYVATPARMDSLAVGALLAIALRSPSSGLARLRRWAPAIGAVTTVLLLAMFVWRKGLVASDPIVQVLGYSLIACCAGAYLSFAVTSPASAPAQRVFAHPALQFFGKYSYGIYVLQAPLRPLLWEQPWVKDPPRLFGFQAPAAFAICVLLSAIATGLALLSWHFYEKRFLLLKEHFRYGTG
jgi:peptidoglycan/LPS O-acetylase OafA/YrhL